ncbi:SDR family NAD(P)-dependent oxidoreductase [Dictyobacter aurantiacus]|uniref:Short-chain dehydrogenase/reductase n=1 Tax=Dictyobacter aurantiacus TaxID=1936993 RepID=A0A401ZBE8_9CHLR|nr:SDR family NAD(P)-dependent oxidoreductase [Dictyobacter aurantiacus]GCE04214.1 short-chain dehydrogenase/reductase [Dictyobacter aurantiacus]
MARKTILITGCSSGFGRCTALDLACRGWHVLATVRKEADSASLLEEAERKHCDYNITPLLCDITQAEQVEKLRDEVKVILQAEQPAARGEAPHLDALLNNAGTAYGGPIELMPLEDIRAQFEINVFAHVGVTQLFLPLLKAARGKIIFVSSISGRISVPVTGVYSASKYALEGLCDALRLELAPFGVRVSLIEPASSPTSIWMTSLQRSFERLGDARDSSPYARLLTMAEKSATQSSQSGFPIQKFSDTVVRILDSSHPRARYSVPFNAALLMLLRRFLPDVVWDRLIRLAMRW